MIAGRSGSSTSRSTCCTSTAAICAAARSRTAKTPLRQMLEEACCSRLVYVNRRRQGPELLKHMRAIGAEGIVSKRAGSLYTGRATRDWRKTKCHTTGQFIATGFQELGPGRIEALHIAEERDGKLVPAGQV